MTEQTGDTRAFAMELTGDTKAFAKALRRAQAAVGRAEMVHILANALYTPSPMAHERMVKNIAGCRRSMSSTVVFSGKRKRGKKWNG